MTILSELDNAALNQGKKKSQIIREALTSYLKEEKIEQWEEENKDAIEKYNKSVEENVLMAQFDVYKNTNPLTNETIPYLLDVQNDILKYELELKCIFKFFKRYS